MTGGTYQCIDCGREYEFDGERVVCWCDRVQTVVAKPCGVCGKPITTAEICGVCADESDTDAFTTNWGSGRSVQADTDQEAER